MALGSPQKLMKLSTWNILSLTVSVVNTGRRRITGYLWTCHQRVTIWILWLLCFHGKAREYCNDLSYDGCHNMKLLTIQKAPFFSVLTEKLVVSELVSKFTLLHGTLLPCYLVTVLPCYYVTLLPCYLVNMSQCYLVTVLPCCRVTKSPQTVLTLSQINLFGII